MWKLHFRSVPFAEWMSRPVKATKPLSEFRVGKVTERVFVDLNRNFFVDYGERENEFRQGFLASCVAMR